MTGRARPRWVKIGKSTAGTLLLVGAMAGGIRAAGTPEEIEYLPGPSGPSPRLSEAVRVGRMLYLSGKIGTLPGTRELAAGGIQGETRQALANIRDVVTRHGSSMARIVRCTVFLADIDEWSAMNDVYVTFFPTNPPARAAVAIDGLVLGARVEIECLAVAR
ncbi:MAG: RidA family protein [Acidobacteriota bacterium]